MYSKFLNLPKTKQDKIINAAFDIFSKTSYQKASTDDIVELAEISKGALFHYFKSKKNLYLYLYDYGMELLLKEFYGKINLDETDLFKRMKEVATIKIYLMNMHPSIFNFMISAVYEEDSRIIKELKKRNDKTVVENYNKLLSNIDITKFKNDIDVDTAIEMIMLTFEGYSSKEMFVMRKVGLSKTLTDRWLSDFDKYIKAMKKIYYK